MKYLSQVKNSLLSALLFVLFISSPLAIAQFYGDVPVDSAQRQAIDYLSSQGIFKGQGEGTRFDPDGLLNRAEWAVLLTREQGVDLSDSGLGFCFPDVDDQWFATAVCYAKDLLWVKGFAAGAEAGLYIPTNNLTFADILVTLSRVQDWPTDIGETWYDGAYNYALESKILPEAVLPWQQVTRAEAAEILFRSIAIRKYNVSKYDAVIAELLTTQREEPEGPSEGPQQESLPRVQLRPFAEAPIEATVARGATNIPVLRFELESEEALILEEFAIRRVSVGRTQDISHARLLINGKIIREGSFSGERNQVVWRNLEVPVAANGLSLVEMSIDFVEDAQPILFYQFEVDPSSFRFNKAIEMQGEVFRGESFQTVAIPAETVTISNDTKLLKIPTIGEDKEVIGRFKITAGDHDLLIKRIRLEDAGDVNDREYSNFRLTIGSNELGFLEKIERNVLDFTVDDYLLEANRSRVFTVRADISDSARKDDSIRLYMEDPEHLYALDFEFNFGVRVINEFTRDSAKCVGSDSPECPAEGLRKRCSKDDIEFGLRDCEIEEESSNLPDECEERTAPVCGIIQEATEEEEAITKTFQNRCLAEKAAATGILPGPCQ